MQDRERWTSKFVEVNKLKGAVNLEVKLSSWKYYDIELVDIISKIIFLFQVPGLSNKAVVVSTGSWHALTF
jgi:hypothetical protein